MRFVCEVCQTRYIIPDERARGRVLKVRCKKCGNVIILRAESEAPAEAPSIAAPSPASRSPRQQLRAAPAPASATTPDHGSGDEATQMVDTDALKKLREDSSRGPGRLPSGPELGKPEPEVADWHVIVGGKQIGPLTMSALIEKMLSGEMSPRSFVWRDGMGDWKRAEEVPDVSRWLPAQPSPTPGPRPVPQPTAKSAVPKPLAKAPEKPKPAKAPEVASKPASLFSAKETADAAKPTSLFPLASKETADAAKTKLFPAADAAPSPASVAPVSTRQAVPEDSAEVDQFFAGAEPDLFAPAAPILAPTVDPFSQVGDAPGLEQPKPGEVTRFFITQAGVTKQKSSWRIAAYAGGGAVFLVLVVVALSQLGVSVPLVTSSDGSGPHIFSGGSNDARLKDELYRKRKAEAAAAAAAAAKPVVSHTSGANPAVAPEQGPLAKKAEQHVDQLDKKDKDQLAQLYASQNLSPVKLKTSTAAAPVIDRPDAPLTADQVSKTVDRFRSGYAACIDRELKRNPNFQGGKIRIVTTIMSSGLVRQAQIQSDDARLARNVSGGPLGGCLTDQTRRMVFPSFQGDPFDAEIPLVVGASL